MSSSACGAKLITVPDKDFSAYCKILIRLQGEPPQSTPERFYEAYYWGHAIRPAVRLLQ